MTAISTIFKINMIPFHMVESMNFIASLPIINGFKIRILNTGQKYWLSDIYDR